MDRTILITGSSSGLGEHAARVLHGRDGWRVLATCRKQADVDRLNAEGLESFLLDVSDPQSIEAGWTETLARTGGTLDALYSNAGFGLPGAIEDVPADALRSIFETNVFGLHDLTCRAVAVMRKQGHGRIIQHSSVLGRVSLRWRGAYNASKHALEGLTDTLRLELRGTDIHVSTLNTGPVTSRFRVNSIPHFERWINWESSAIADRYKSELLPFLYEPGPPTPFDREPIAVTRRVIHALESRKPRARYLITPASHIAEAVNRILPQSLSDAIAGRI